MQEDECRECRTGPAMDGALWQVEEIQGQGLSRSTENGGEEIGAQRRGQP